MSGPTTATAGPGGIFYDDLIETWSDLTRTLDTQLPAAPVDGESWGYTRWTSIAFYTGIPRDLAFGLLCIP